MDISFPRTARSLASSATARSSPFRRTDPPAIRPAGAGTKPHDGKRGHGLSAAGFPDDAQCLAGAQFEGEVADDGHRTFPRIELHMQVPDLQERGTGPVRSVPLPGHYLRLSFGLSASFRPSPIRLTASTVRKIAMPGNVTAHQASRM